MGRDIQLFSYQVAELGDRLRDAWCPRLRASHANAIAIAVGRRKQRARTERNLVAQCLAEQLLGVAAVRQLHPEDVAARGPGDARACREMLGDCRGDVRHLVAEYAPQMSQLAVITAAGEKIRQNELQQFGAADGV